MEGCLPNDHQYIIPTKQVKNLSDVKKWEKSEAYHEYLGFIMEIGESIRNKKIRECQIDENKNEAIFNLINVLNTLSKIVKEVKPFEDEAQRFGNKAYQIWFEKMEEKTEDLLGKLVKNPEVIKEISVYFRHSFGNPTRIDYGTGHEMNFIMFLCSLFKIGLLNESDKVFIGLNVFERYMNLVREIQLTYKLEPAGSQGVWSLDDYQFVPFIWGASQMIGNPRRIKPKSIGEYEIAEMLYCDYHIYACIKYIHQVKTGPFSEHSNQLWNISGVPSWEKVTSGLIKMYRAEVLSKFPVIQHSFFGSIFTLDPVSNDKLPTIEPPSKCTPLPSSTGVPIPDLMTRMKEPRLLPSKFIPE